MGNVTGQDSTEVPPSCILAEAILDITRIDLLDGESQEKLSSYILGTQDQDAQLTYFSFC